MKLNEPLKTSVDFNGIELDVDCSFDVVLDVFEMFEDDVMNDIEKMQLAIEIMTGQVVNEPDDIIAMWRFIDDNFIKIKRENIVYDRAGNPMPVAKDDDSQLIDFEVDAKEIYASFMQAYNINLFEEQGRMQWSEFVALLNGLPEDTIMMKIVKIRSWKPSKDESSEHKSEMRRLQSKYRLRRKEGD